MEIIGVKLKKIGKIHFFTVENIVVKKGDEVIVSTEKGKDLGVVVIANQELSKKINKKPMHGVVRIANDKDREQLAKCIKIEEEALRVCKEQAEEFGIKMKVLGVEHNFDDVKITFFFTADGRIDFRLLVRKLATIYKTRIELRQVGARDEVKLIGGNGICGRELCCKSFLTEFDAVTMKMAKEQNISLNPTKVSGNCGRLMCCLKYEDEVYDEKVKKLPFVGQTVKTPDGIGEIYRLEILKEQALVKVKDGEGILYKKYKADEMQVINKSKK